MSGASKSSVVSTYQGALMRARSSQYERMTRSDRFFFIATYLRDGGAT
jgi:hypothetical protein